MTIGLTPQANTMRNETLAQLRTVAIFGQTLTLVIAYFRLSIEIDYNAAAIVIAMWSVINIAQLLILPRSARMSEFTTLFLLLIDLLELTALVYLSGGINNPFALLMIVPVVIAANTLPLASFLLITAIAIIALFFLMFNHEPLLYKGAAFAVSELLRYGQLAAIIISMLFLSFFTRRITIEALNMTSALAATELALQREHRLASLGGLVAAYAHELGTPLANIRLASADLLDEDLPEHARLDAEQIRADVLRCSQILEDMGRIGKDDIMIKTAPMTALIEEAAAPHQDRGKDIHIENLSEIDEPIVERAPAIIHGLRNIIQNAVDFAKKDVTIELIANERFVIVRVLDDGRGYSPEVISRIGEPYLRKRGYDGRKGYDGMGLGLFISKTMLENTGATITFGNRPRLDQSGAVVSVKWPVEKIVLQKSQVRAALGENREQDEE